MKLCITKHLAAIALATAIALPVLAQTASPLGKLPLFFEANYGQSQSTAAFLARTADAQYALSASGVEMNFRRAPDQTSQLQMNFVGANPSAEIHGDAEQTGKMNYLIGNEQSQWHAGVPIFAKVRVEKIYPGVDIVFYGNQHQLEYDFNFAAGANPAVVALRFDGAEKIQLGANGELVISLGGGEIRQPQPQIYQTVNGTRHAVSGGYKILASQTVAFKVGDYDHSLPLVIDPILSHSTFLGGNYGDIAWAVAINPNDQSIYVAGQTLSTRITNNVSLSTPGAYQTNYQGGDQIGDAFVARFDNTGTNLVYFTYLGGSGDDVAYGLAVDSQTGYAYVCGATDSTNFPTLNAIPGGTNIHGTVDAKLKVYPSDAFVAALDASGSRLIYSTYLGGESYENAYGIALDSAGDAFVTGYTYSTNFPGTTSTFAYQPKIGCTNNAYTFHYNAFVTEIAAGGNSLKYSTYLGGTNADSGRAIAYNNNEVFVAGYTASTNFPTFNYISNQIISITLVGTNKSTGADVFRTNIFSGHFLNGTNNLNLANANLANDAFVAAFTDTSASSTTNLTLLYSTLLGSTNDDLAYGIAADASGNAYVVGSTTSPNFPSLNTVATNLLDSYVRTNTLGGRATNAFLSQIKWNGTNAYLGYSAIFGGHGIDVATAVALDASNNAFVTGYASSTNFPVTKGSIFGSLRATNSGDSDVFVIVFDPDASALLYSTYLGGRKNDFGYGIAVDSSDSAYIVGRTDSTNFPAFNAYQKMLNGTNDAFLTKIIIDSPTLNPGMSGTNFLVTVPPLGDLNSSNFSLETVTNLIMRQVITKGSGSQRVVFTNWVGATNWVVITNRPTVNNGTNIFTFDPTNEARFFRFHK